MQLERSPNRRFPFTVSALVAALLISAARAAHTWRLDPGFGAEGQVITPFFDTPDCAGLVIQANGRIITCGSDYPSNLRAITLAAYRKNGRLDTRFGSGGKVVQEIGNRNATIFQAAVQRDGKIVLAGGISRDATLNESDPGLVRFLPNGALDPSFGNGGVVTTPLGHQKVFFGVAVQRDGKLVAVGDAGDNGVQFSVARYLPNGSPDTGFGTDGKVVSSFGVGATIAQAVALQPDGKLLVTGNSQAGPVVVRLDPDGTPDSTFGTSGSSGAAVIAGIGPNLPTRALAVQKDHRVLVTGQMQSGNLFLARLNPDGTPDSGFGDNGLATGAAGEGRCVLVQKDGRAVVIGSAETSGFVERFTTSGVPDASFAPSGTIPVATSGAEIGLSRGALQKDGRIVVGGTSVTNDASGVLVQRYRP